VGRATVGFVSSPAVSPGEMVASVFLPLEEEPASNHSHLIGAVTEYLRCMEAASLAAPASLPCLLVSLLQHDARLHELAAWAPVLGRPPGKAVALEVAEAAKAYPPAMQVVQDLLHRPSTHDVYINVLLKEGNVVVRASRQHGQAPPPPLPTTTTTLIVSIGAMRRRVVTRCSVRAGGWWEHRARCGTREPTAWRRCRP
jgi:hypothetical protein